jgi:hypothetical protein
MSARLRRTVTFALAVGATVIVAGVLQADAPPGQYMTFGKDATCIADNFTHLTWMRQPVMKGSLPDAQSFSQAASSCAQLNSDVGASGWRLPSVNELQTLVDDKPRPQSDGTNAPQKRAIDANAFPATPVTVYYWTSSAAGSNAWFVDFGSGTAGPIPVNGTSLYVRCVTATWPPPGPCTFN